MQRSKHENGIRSGKITFDFCYYSSTTFVGSTLLPISSPPRKMNGYIVDTWDYDDDHLFRISAHDDKTPAIQAARLTLPIYISLLHSTCYPRNRPHCWLQQLPFLIEGIMLFHFIQLSYRIPQQPHPPSPSASI